MTQGGSEIKESELPEEALIDTAFLHLTRACDLRCDYCYFSAAEPEPGELTLAEWGSVFQELSAIAPQKVVLTGGEPLLKQGIWELLELPELAELRTKTRVCLNTNGRLVGGQAARRLVQAVDEVRLSLDGARPDHDAQRGEGSYDAAMQAAAHLREYGMEPKLLITVTSKTLAGLPSFVANLLQSGFRKLSVHPVKLIGRAKGTPEIAVSYPEVQKALAQAWRQVTGAKVDSDWFPGTQNHCGVGRYLNLSPTGIVTPCHVLDHPRWHCGNVRETSLRKLLRPGQMLRQLANLDFQKQADRDPNWRPLLTAGTCFGDSPAKDSWFVV
ncbi:MAG: radical SAM protein [Planctomycetota bacterium]|nr:MAG: radical SAM protein [Planctomycetota bacterium]